jgi:RES domain-containing protein
VVGHRLSLQPAALRDGQALLNGVGSLRNGVRWTPPGSFATVYAADSPETALAEVLNHYRYYGLPLSASMPRTFVAIEVGLGFLLDLTTGPIRRRLGVSLRRMVEEDWRREQSEGREALTQAIGRSAFESGYEGLIVPSAARRGAKNLLVFPDRVRASSRLVVLRAEDLSPVATPDD